MESNLPISRLVLSRGDYRRRSVSLDEERRAAMMVGLGSATPGAADAIAAAAAKYGISPTLLNAVATQESGLNQSAVSSAGAIGVMQLMPGTAAQYGANPYDLNQNVDAGAHYLSDMLRRYNGDTSLALAAYNAGPGNVDKYGGIPPFTETQNYVNSILAMVGADTGGGGTGDGLPPDTTGTPDDVIMGMDSNVFAILVLGSIAALWFIGRNA